MPTDGPADIPPPLPGTPGHPWRTADLPAIGGAIGPEPADFVVDEIPAYPTEGDGDHWFVRVQKTGLSTPAARDRLARAAGVDTRDVGFAGRKDTHAITTQWFSLPAVAGAEAPPLDGLTVGEDDGALEVLEWARHRNKLRLGHLAGNRFAIRLVGVDPAWPTRLPALVEAIARGVPNYYGGQRFGAGGRGVRQALAFAAEPRRRVRDPKFLASVLQSAVFNTWLGARVADGLLDRAIEGDVLQKRETGGLFVCADPAADDPRVAAGEVDPTGPMPGPKLRRAAGEAEAREQAAARRWGTDLRLGPIHRFAPGTRRGARLVPRDLSWAAADDGLVLRFELPAGAYATTVLAELMHPEAG